MWVKYYVWGAGAFYEAALMCRRVQTFRGNILPLYVSSVVYRKDGIADYTASKTSKLAPIIFNFLTAVNGYMKTAVSYVVMPYGSVHTDQCLGAISCLPYTLKMTAAVLAETLVGPCLEKAPDGMGLCM